MRLLFLLLLLANLALFAWTQWLEPSSSTAPAAGAALEVPRILLAGESAPATAAAADAVSDPPIPAEAGTAPAADGTVAAAATAPGAAATRCISVGPLTDLEAAARVTRVLVELGYSPRQRPADGLVPDGYIVLVGGLAGPEDQSRVQRRLERGGLTDAAALPAPVEAPQAANASATVDGTYAVSAGLFSERRRAERRAEVVRKIGLMPTIEERRRNGTVYWLDLDLRSPAEPEALQATGLGDGALQILPCPEPGPTEPAIR
jgi:hypothetical protein